jgi:predicted amidophosphoribosyltransferase
MWNAMTRVRGRVGAALDDFSEHWIGWTFPPVERAFAQANWSPDSSSDYCQRCGDGVGPGEATDEGCGTCRQGSELEGGIADGVIRLGAYVDPLRGWVHAIKYQRWQEMAEAFGGQLAEALRASGRIDLARAAIVPMPMPWQRRLYRGIDHALLLAQWRASWMRRWRGCWCVRISRRRWD